MHQTRNMLASNSYAKIEYLVVTLLICISGNHAVTGTGGLKTDAVTVLVGLFLAALLFKYKKARITPGVYVVFVIFFSILAIQCVSFNFYPLTTIAGFFVRLFTAYAAIRLVKDFPRIYVRVMFVICVISLFFYPINVFFHGQLTSLVSPITRFTDVRGYHFILYNADVISSNLYRNPGCFWEPGAFAGYILLAIVFLGLGKQKYARDNYRILLAVFSISLFTTLSTTGYVLYPLVMFLQMDLTVKNAQRVAAMIILLAAASTAMYQLSFVGRKITGRYNIVVSGGQNWEKSRFGTLIFDFRYIKQRPFFGWGLHEKTRFALDHGEILEGRGNGLSDFVVKFGFLGMGAYLACTFMGLLRLTRFKMAESIVALAFVILVLNGEAFLGFSLFQGLMFLEGPWKRTQEDVLEHRAGFVNVYNLPGGIRNRLRVTPQV